MKLTASALTKSAASTRSPSFSRSSSSTRITILPTRMSAMISGIVLTVISVPIRVRNAEPQARRAEYPGQAHELRIAAFRKRSIKRFTTQARALSNRGDTALRLCDIAEGLHQPLRVPLVKHRFDVDHRVRGVFQPFEKMRSMGR